MIMSVREKDMIVILILLTTAYGGSSENADEISFLAELPLSELLSQKKLLMSGNSTSLMPSAMPLVGKPEEDGLKLKGIHKHPARKTFYSHDYDDDDEYDEDDKEWMHKKKKKKKKEKHHDVLNISLTALSYLACGGYLLCMIVSALREKRRIAAAYVPPVGTAGAVNNQFTNVLQQYLNQRPIRIRFPAVTVHQGGKKRRKRSDRADPSREEKQFSIIDVIDYVEALSQIADVGN